MKKNKPGKRIVGITLALMMAVTPFFSTHATEAKSPPGTQEPAQQEMIQDENETNETDVSDSSDTQKEEQTEKEKPNDSVKDKDQGSEDKAKGSEDEAQDNDIDAEDSKASDEDSKTTYTSKINGVEITAKLSNAEAIPDDADLKASLITKNSKDYNYDAYMKALNDGKEKPSYTEDNTLLYDIAFMKDGKELEPTEGNVSVTFDFKDNQLAEDLGAKKASDVNVIHLPLKDSVRDKFDSTKAAKSIDEDDINKEEIKDKDLSISLSKETVKFETKDFSVFAYTVDFTHDEYTYSIAGEDSIMLSDLFKELKIDEDLDNVKDVDFSDPELIKVTEKNSDWELKSLKPFSSEEALTVTLNNGSTIVITVTDAQISGSITFYETDSTTIDTAASVDGNYYVSVGNGNNIKAVAKVAISQGVAPLDFGSADVSPSDEYTLLKFTGEEELTAEYASQNWYYDGSQRMTKPDNFGAYSFDQTSKPQFKAVKQAAYEVEIIFEGATASHIGSGYSVYAGVQADNQNGNKVTYYSQQDVTLDNINSKTIAFSSFKRINDTPNSVSYSAGDVVNVALGKINVEANGEERGTIRNDSTIVKNGDVLDGFAVNVTTSDNKTTYTFSKPDPYYYNIKENSGDAIAFDSAYNNNWYLLSTLKKANGKTYYYVKPVALNGAAAIPAAGNEAITMYYTANSEHMGDIVISNESDNNYNNGNTTTSVYQNGDVVKNELVHVSNTAFNYKQIISGDSGNNRELFGDGTVANKYSVASASEDGVGTITLTKVSDFKIKTVFRNANNEVITDETSLPDDYKLLVKMKRDGSTYYALHTVDSSSNPSGASNAIVFYKYTVKDGNATLDKNTPYYYSGNGTETISTQVVTGANELSADLIQHKVSGAVFYNENTVGGTQNSDLTKDLYSTSSEVSDDNIMTTTFTKRKDNGVAHDINVSFYKNHTNNISDAVLNPDEDNMDTSADAYFFRVLLYNNGKLVAYKIVPVTAAEAASANSTGEFTHTIAATDEFKLVDDNGIDIEGGSLHYDPTVYSSKVRFFKAKTAGQLPQNLSEVSSKGVDTFEGYDFWQNIYEETKDGDTITRTETDLSLYKAYKKKYQVQIVIDDETTPSTADAISLAVEAVHQSSNKDVLEIADIASSTPSYRTEKTAGGKKVITYLIEDQTTNPITKNWTTSPTTNTISGNETFNLQLKQNNVSVSGIYPVKIGNDYFTVSYDTGNGEYSEDDKTISVDDENDITTITHSVYLKKAKYDSAIDPYDVLGPEGPEFGIIADRYEQYGHTETNMAVNSFMDEGGNIDLDGAGDAVMPFYVGSIDDGSTLWISQATRVGVDLFITQDINDNHLKLTTTKPVEKTILSENEINNHVNRLIDTFTANSEALAQKTTIKPSLHGNNKTLDLTMFPDNITIYVDCSDMEDVIAAGGWNINKYPGQSIVFNMPGTGTVKIGEFYVHLFDEAGHETEVVQSTTSAMDGDPAHNKRVDEVILEHITFNAYEADQLDIDNASALFLAPNASKVTQSNGAGWIATGGTVESHAEWHFYRHQRRYKVDGEIDVKKDFEGTGWGNSDSFDFRITAKGIMQDGELDNSKTAVESVPMPLFKTVKISKSSQNNPTSFGTITFTKAGVYVYEVQEIIPDIEDRIPNVHYDDSKYTAIVTVTQNTDGTFESNVEFRKDGSVVETEDNAVVFTNTKTEEEVGSVSVEKVWDNADGSATWPEGAEIVVTLLKGGEATDKTLTLTSEKTSGTFENLPLKDKQGNEIEYSVEETSVSGVPANYGTTITGNATDGYKITNSEEYAETEITFEGTKFFENGQFDPNNPFTFNVYQVESEAADGTKTFVKDQDGNDKVITTGTTAMTAGQAVNAIVSDAVRDAAGQNGSDADANADNGSDADAQAKQEIHFGKIKYTLDDLKNKDGSYDDAREFTYVIKEVIPDTADENGYDAEADIQYDTTEKVVIVTLDRVDEDGTLKAEIDYSDDELSFTNKKKYTKLKLTKTIDGYNAGDTEGEFTNATLVFKVTYKVDGEEVVRYMNVQYTADTGAVTTAELDKIPIDADISVDEVYSDNYESEQTSDIELVTDKETGESYYTVSFDNTLKRIEHGSGIINKYEKDASGNFHLQYRIKDGTNTEEPK